MVQLGSAGRIGCLGWWIKYRDLVAGLGKSDRCDGLQQALTVPERNAEFFKIAVRQLAEDLGVNVILAK